MRRQKDNDDDGGLDSLLDTMTNVVGILVLVLIVTQMSVADVVSRITEEMRVEPEQVEALNETLRAKQEERAELEEILVDPLDIDTQRQMEELKKKKELLERRRRLLEEDKAREQNQFAMKQEEDRKKAEENEKKIAESKKNRDELSKTITEMTARQAELEAKLEQASNIKAPPAVEITIPDPRPAPPNSKPLLFVCAENELFPLDPADLRKRAEVRAKAIIARYKLDRDPEKGIDPEAFTEHYQKMKDRNDYFEAEYFVLNNTWPRIRLIPRSGSGVKEQEVTNPRSRFHTQGVALIDRTKFYTRFFVLPDSHEIYVAARSALTEAQILSGWEPQPEDWNYVTSIPGGIRLGPPPKPNPNAKPAPPAKPANVID
ncbi:MAG: hypothetical protein WDZ51_06410 [Pirellulaceae bacterium]